MIEEKLKKNYAVNIFGKDGLYGTFQCSTTKTILEAAEEAGFDLPYSCRAGACSSCAGKLLSGKLDQSEQSFLDVAQLEIGYALTCVAYPISDVSIQTHQEENLY